MCEFTFEDNPRITGWIAKTCLGGVQADLIANPHFHFPELFPQYVFTLDVRPEATLLRNWRNYHLRILSPAQQLAFKLLMWRGREQDKFDPEDARALILDSAVTPDAVRQALFPRHTDPTVLQTLRARLRALAQSDPDPRVQRFYRGF